MSCCAAKTPQTPAALSDAETVKAVNESYSARALKAGEAPEYAKAVAESFGYSTEELLSIPAESNMGLSCGNPTATAKLKEGERLLDLGSGGGIDVFLAAAKVGPKGQAIGLDGSAEMVSLARRNAVKHNLHPPHVVFAQAALGKDLPIEPNSIDCIISNCVINLLPLSEKASVLKEAHRVLKPGGRIVLDDIIAKRPLPDELRGDLVAYIGCIAGAILEEEYRKIMADAGFPDVLCVDKKSDLNVYWQTDKAPSTCCSTPSAGAESFPKPGFNANEWIASYQFYAIKAPSDAPVSVPETSLLRWWDAYPTVKSSPASLTAEDVTSLIRDPTKSGKDFVVIDVRRNDHAGGHVKGSEQWAAQTFYNDLPGFFEGHKNIEKVIFYCQSSNGRGPRCAGWYQDYLDGQEAGSHASKAYVLQGGIKGWLAKYEGQDDLVDRD